QLARLYDRLAEPGRAQELRGLAAREWGQARLDELKKSPPAGEEEARKVEEEARALFRQSGEAYEQAAEASVEPAEKAERCWRGAGSYLDGQDPRRAAEVLERLVKLPAGPRRLGEAWLALAEAHRSLQNEAAARAAYLECIKYPGPSGYRARYHLAMAEARAG